MKQLITFAYDLCWLKEIEDNFLDFTHKTEFEMLKHLLSQCLKLKNREKIAKLKNTEYPWISEEDLALYFAKLKKEQAKLKKDGCHLGQHAKSHSCR